MWNRGMYATHDALDAALEHFPSASRTRVSADNLGSNQSKARRIRPFR